MNITAPLLPMISRDRFIKLVACYGVICGLVFGFVTARINSRMSTMKKNPQSTPLLQHSPSPLPPQSADEEANEKWLYLPMNGHGTVGPVDVGVGNFTYTKGSSQVPTCDLFLWSEQADLNGKSSITFEGVRKGTVVEFAGYRFTVTEVKKSVDPAKSGVFLLVQKTPQY